VGQKNGIFIYYCVFWAFLSKQQGGLKNKMKIENTAHVQNILPKS
jgi:hypothetical protein